MIHTGGHVEGRTFNLGEEEELIPLLPVYTRSSNASLFSLSQQSSIYYIHPPPFAPYTHTHTHSRSQLSQHTHSIYVAYVRLCVYKYVYAAPILCPRTAAQSESVTL